jgi:FAD/FMN-containing dehydrogenase
MYSLVEKMRERLAEAGLWKEEGGGRIREVVGYGHIGDGALSFKADHLTWLIHLFSGNLHINICADKYDDEIEKVIEPYVYEIVAEERGSISAEHGLGKSY